MAAWACWSWLGACGEPTTPSSSSASSTTEPADSTSASPELSTSDGADSTGDTEAPHVITCGDGLREGDEECDLGELNGEGLYCSEICTLDQCGDGSLGYGEACDDGNRIDDDGCTNACTLPSCGDGVTQAGEECDAGVLNAWDAACLPDCRAATCGDDSVQTGVEACDRGNLAGAFCSSMGFDGGVLLCNPDCSGFDTEGCFACGDGEIESIEECEGDDVGGLTCEDFGFPGLLVSGGAVECIDCEIEFASCSYCYDGIIEGTEECEPFVGAPICMDYAPLGTTSADGVVGCPDCTLDLSGCLFCVMDSCWTCGDGVVEGLEACDGLELAGQDCTSLGLGFGGGSLACDSQCGLDTSGCCVDLGMPCLEDADCCSMSCDAGMGVCQ